jgi:TolA-binding protein
MKTLLILVTAVLLTSCGVGQRLGEACGEDIKMGCNAIFGDKDEDQDKAIADVQNKNNEQDARITSLEQSVATMIANINSLSENIDDLEDTTSSTYNTVNALQSIVNANTAQLLSLSNSITVLNGNLNTLNGNLTSLSNSLSKTIVDFKDPCGNGPGFDEVLMKTKDGKYIAYFESNGNRFLSIIENGSYRTTDESGCYFTVNNGVISNEHY